jgi:hypothetical protein
MKARRLARFVAREGALPVPGGPVPRSELDQARDDVMGACLARWEEEQDNVRLRLALASAQRGRRELRADAAFAEGSRQRWRTAAIEAEQERDALRARVAELEQRETAVAEFVAKRAEYITAIRNCHPDNGHDYDRWQGHAAARRQLAELLGLPVAWPPEDAVSVAKSVDKLTRLLAPTQALREDPHDGPLAHSYRIPRDLPETGGRP